MNKISFNPKRSLKIFFSVFWVDLFYNKRTQVVISWFSLWLRYLEYVRVGGNSGRLPRKEITQHEITISNHSFNGTRNAIILKFWLWRKSAGVKSMVTSGFDSNF